MAISDVLVHLKSHESWSPHIDYSIGIAKVFNARLRAMVTFAGAEMMRSYSRIPDELVVEQILRESKVAAKLEEKFTAACGAAGVKGIFTTAEGPAGEIIPWAARLHDLTIIEQRDPTQDELGYDVAEETALSGGRPVLVVPRKGRFSSNPRHILVAWNGSQQSAAAVQGAIAFIERAKKVTVCSGAPRQALRGSVRVPEIDIVSHLRNHVKKVDHEVVDVGDAHVGEYLLSRCNELDCGMIVMGAYGRSRFSEIILGGATRYIFGHMTAPILMGS